ncbi:MAG: hypothetical protein KDJ54_09505 [Candidatus Competibacteraceae bacterium]|nr:hypothetical protein [Candidatus Competibacteraceae bacterium]
MLKHIIRPAVEECGYKAIRADEIDKPGIITSQVIQHVISDPLVIADLSETNPNVFYELAIRHAIRKPLVQIIQKGERIPFDVAGTRTVQFDHKDLDSVDEAKTAIVDQIKALEKDPNDIETPISLSLDLQTLRQSDNPEERSLADIVSAITAMKNGLSKLEERIVFTSGPDSKLFHELMERVDILPQRIAKEFLNSPKSLKSNRIVDPFVVRELTNMLPKRSSGPISLLIVLSVYRDTFPWLYEIGMEAYRRATAGDWTGAREVIKDLQMMAETSLRGPIMEELFGNRKEAYMLMEELPFLLERVADEAMMKSEKNHNKQVNKDASR